MLIVFYPNLSCQPNKKLENFFSLLASAGLRPDFLLVRSYVIKDTQPSDFPKIFTRAARERELFLLVRPISTGILVLRIL